MESAPFRHFADPSTIRLFPRDLLRRLLVGHEEVCRTRGLDPDLLTDDPSTDELLWRFLTGPGLPGDLLDALHKIDDLADEAGQDMLTSDVLMAAEPAATYGSRLDPTSLACLAWLEHREAFLRVHGRRLTDRIKNFREYEGRRAQQARVPPEDVLRALEATFAEDFGKRRRSRHCRIRTFEADGRIGFAIGHGRLIRRDEALEEEADTVRDAILRWRPKQHDLVVYDNRVCRLQVHSSDAPTIRLYASGFGQALFGDPGWFQVGTVVSLGPLIEMGRSALDPTEGIRSADLVALSVRMPDETSGSVDDGVLLTSRDVFRLIQTGVRVELGEGELVKAKLHVRYASGGRARVVELVPPNQVVFDRRRDEAATLGFLETRGFLAGPPPGA